MGRLALIINETQLENCIAKLESERTFSNLSELCQAVADSDWGKNVKNTRMIVRGISPQKVYQVINEHRIPHLTKPGKRGRAAGQKVERSTRSDKLSKKPVMVAFAAAMKKEVSGTNVPEKYKALAEEALAGSFKASIKLHCAQCFGYTEAHKSCDGAVGGVPCGLYPAHLLVFPNRRNMVEGDDGFWDSERAKNE